jgi:hypothetical protein
MDTGSWVVVGIVIGLCVIGLLLVTWWSLRKPPLVAHEIRPEKPGFHRSKSVIATPSRFKQTGAAKSTIDEEHRAEFTHRMNELQAEHDRMFAKEKQTWEREDKERAEKREEVGRSKRLLLD